MGLMKGHKNEKSASTRQADAINTGAESLMKGSKVWVRGQAGSAWESGELSKLEGSTAHVLMDKGGNTITLPLLELVPANPKLQDGIPDLTHLSYLNEPGILYNLHYRYNMDDIYTFAGPVLIAVNPCKALPLYTPEVANAYKAGARDVRQSANMPPHIYLVAANAFRRMLREKTSQSLIVNGESGAGKTETTKKAMQYFATLAGGTGVEDQVLETNPILEAFGNAKTLRNHNSSRFGKLIQIHFNQSHHICGAAIKTYLLEKSRVVHQLKGERSYHIFYQLVRGANKAQKEELHLPDHPTGFKYLAASGCTDIDGVNDAEEFRVVCSALTDIGINADQQHSLFRLLAGVLWLGNLDFEDDPADRANDATRITKNQAVDVCCELFGVSYEKLNQCLTRKRLLAAGETITKLLNREESKDCRDALSKALYSATFDWIVARINDKLNTGKAKAGSGLSISILDIYGFEQFQTNSFEQLCINYANERLQQQFTRHLFTLEQQEYESEGIDWTKVEFIDNQECVDCIEMVPPKGLGVLAVLDAQCRFPKATDNSFAHTLKDTLIKHPHFEFNPRAAQDFTIVHYAGKVTYSSAGFLDKNRDTLNTDLIDFMVSCDPAAAALVVQLGQAIKEETETNAKKGQTVGSRFSQQLAELIQELDATGLHFVRCIKPNFALKPHLWEEAMALHQLKCCGVLEVARIARAGYPTRYPHSMFAERYAILLPREEQADILAAAEGRNRNVSGSGVVGDESTPSAMAACQKLIKVFQLSPEQYQIGRTKVFFKPGVLGYLEDKWATMQNSAVQIQSYWRMYREKSKYQRMRQAAIMMQSVYRTIHEKRQYDVLKMQTRAAKVIQRRWRGYHDRQKFLKIRHAVSVIQMAWRRSRLSKRVKRRVFEREKKDMMARLEQDKFETVRTQFGCDMDEVRAALAAWKDAREKAVAAGDGDEAVDLSAVMADAQTKRALPKVQVVMAPAKEAEESQEPPADGPICRVCRKAMGLEDDESPEAESGGVAISSTPRGRVSTDVASPTHTNGGAELASSPGRPHMLSDRALSARAMEAAAEIQAGRQLAAQDINQEVEKLKRDVIRLGKRVELEEYQKKRYQHKYEEQNRNWMEQLQVLQQYMAQVRAAFGDARLPPLPTALQAAANGTVPAGAPGLDAIPAPGAAGPPPSAFAPGAAVFAPVLVSPVEPVNEDPMPPPPEERKVEKLRSFGRPGREIALPTDNNSFGRNDSDGANGAHARGANGLSNQSSEEVAPNGGVIKPGEALLAARQNGVGGAIDRRKRNMAVVIPDDPGAASNLPAPDFTSPSRPVRGLARNQSAGKALGPRDPSAALASRLDKDLEMVQQAMEDNVEFINEVAYNPYSAPNMNPKEVLAHTRKKFEVWAKEFQSRLAVAEETIRQVSQAPAPGANRAVKAGGGGSGFMKGLFGGK